MKRSILLPRTVLFFTLFLFSETRAADSYEIGSVALNGMKCTWTAYSASRHISKELIRLRSKLDNCIRQRVEQYEKSVKKCKDHNCFNREGPEIFSECCVETGGDLQ